MLSNHDVADLLYFEIIWSAKQQNLFKLKKPKNPAGA